MPADMVMGPASAEGIAATACRARSAADHAVWTSPSGRTQANSSPPIRASVSSGRTRALSRSATSLATWAKTSSGVASAATSVATRRSAACSAAKASFRAALRRSSRSARWRSVMSLTVPR